MTTTQVRHRLTKAEMAGVLAAIEADGWTAGVVETFRVLGVNLSDPDCPSISPGDYAIPHDQWGTIAEACGATGNVLGRVNHMLDWMNYAPSGYEED